MRTNKYKTFLNSWQIRSNITKLTLVLTDHENHDNKKTTTHKFHKILNFYWLKGSKWTTTSRRLHNNLIYIVEHSNSGKKSFDSIRFGNLINLLLVHFYSNSKLGVIRFVDDDDDDDDDIYLYSPDGSIQLIIT